MSDGNSPDGTFQKDASVMASLRQAGAGLGYGEQPGAASPEMHVSSAATLTLGEPDPRGDGQYRFPPGAMLGGRSLLGVGK